MTELKLKPCPFCGGKAFIVDGKMIMCVCGATMKSFNDWKPFTEQEVVERWNRRVGSDTECQKKI